MNKRQEARRIYDEEGLLLSEIAERLGVPASTVRAWKSKDCWSAPRSAPDALGSSRAQRDWTKPQSPGCYTPFQPRNRESTLHGLFARYLPDETRSIVEQLETRSPVDILWDQILLAYAALLRAQKLMHVRDENDHRVDQTSWDRQANYLRAQAQAQSSLQKMIDQYDHLCQSDAATEEQRARIDKLRQSIDIDKRRLEIDERKANMDPESEDETGIVYYPLTDESLLDGALPDPEGF